MAQVEVNDTLLEQLTTLLERSNLTVDELLQKVIQDYGELYEKNGDDNREAPSTTKRLLESAKRANISMGETDVSERSREILETEYYEYLKNRMNRDAD